MSRRQVLASSVSFLGEPLREKTARLTGECSGMFEGARELEDEIKKRLEAIGYEPKF